MALLTGINLTGVYCLDGVTVESLATYQLLESEFDGGKMFRTVTRPEFVMTKEFFTDLLRLAKSFIEAVGQVQKTRQTEIPDIPVELDILATAPGVNYSIEMGDLQQTITWDVAAQELTFAESLPFSISYTAYIYYINSLHDLAYAIDHL